MVSKCVVCGNIDIRTTEISAIDSHGQDMLPGTGFFRHAKFEIGVCASCGYTHWFVRDQDIEKVKNSKKFKSKFDINRT